MPVTVNGGALWWSTPRGRRRRCGKRGELGRFGPNVEGAAEGPPSWTR